MVPPETGSYWIKDHVNEKKKPQHQQQPIKHKYYTKEKKNNWKKKKVNLFLVFHVAKVYNNIK